MNLFRENVLINGTQTVLYAREDSPGDRGSIDGVFKLLDYELDGYRAFPALKRYFERHAGSKRALIIDAGANIGASATYFRFKWPNSQLYCIEPEKKNFALLNLNLADSDAQTVQAGLASKEGTMFLFDPNMGDMGFKLSDSGTIPVPTITVPGILNKFDAETYFPFICKIDIEGGEKELFSGNYEWVKRFPAITLETHDWANPFDLISKNLFGMLGENNFDVVIRRGNLILFNRDLLLEYHQQA